MTGSGRPRHPNLPMICARRRSSLSRARPSRGQLAIPEPTAVAMLETQRMLFSPANDVPGFADFLWADAIPKLLQARLIENYDIAHPPLRTADTGQADFQLLIDIRRFRIAVGSEPTAEIGLSARMVDKDRKVIASRLFEEGQKFDKVEPAAAIAAFSDAFGRIAKDKDRLDGSDAIGAAWSVPRSGVIRGFSDMKAGRGSGPDRAGTPAWSDGRY